MSFRLLSALLYFMSFICFSASADPLSAVTLRGHSGQVQALAYSPDGLYLASADIDENTIRVWDTVQGAILREIRGHRAPVTDLLFSPAGDLISASDDQTIRVWNVRTGESIRQLLGHRGPVICLDMDPNGQRLISGSTDQTLRLWDLQTGRELATAKTDAPVSQIRFSPDGLWFVAGNELGDLQQWDAVSLTLLREYRGHSDHTWALDISPDGRQVASGAWDGIVRLWTVDGNGFIVDGSRTLAQFDTWVLSLAFSPDGQMVAVGLLDWEGKSTIHLISLLDGRTIHHFDRKSRHALAFSPNRLDLAAAGSSDGSIQIWRSSATQPVLVAPGWGETVEHPEDVKFEWIGTPGAVYYQVQIALDPDFSHLLEEHQATDEELTTSLSPPKDEEPEELWWRVRTNAFGIASEWSSPSHFFTSLVLGCQFQFIPASLNLEAEQIADIQLRVVNARAIESIRFELRFDPNVIYVLRIASSGEQPSRRIELLEADVQNELGMVGKIELNSALEKGLSGSATLVKISVRTREPGETLLSVGNIQLVDIDGGTIVCAAESIRVSVRAPISPWDVNHDGKVNVLDFITIGQAFGQLVLGNPEMNPDVNRDGVVDVLDFSLVAQHFGEGTAAPSLTPNDQSALWDVLEYLDSGPLDPVLRARLQAVLRSHVSYANHLGQNFPNPFNPETWIPFELAMPGEVRIEIHNVNGNPVRTLAIGSLPAGRYLSREQAIYWDGKDSHGQPVPSGLYFYTIFAGRFAQTRKMTVVR